MIYSKQFLLDQFSPIAIYDHLKNHFNENTSFLFESATSCEGNYSFISIGTLEHLQYKDGSTTYQDESGHSKTLEIDPFSFLKDYYSDVNKQYFASQAQELKVGYVDGFIGMIGYDAVKIFEPRLKQYMDDLEDTLDVPDIDLIRPKFTLVFSHKDQKVTLISPLASLAQEFEVIENLLKSDYDYIPLKTYHNSSEGSFAHSKEKFFEMVEASKKMIRSGDVFQILMANRFTQKSDIDPFSFYRVLRSKNPSPYMFLMEYPDYTIVGSSPEVMVGLKEGEILLRPIAGTRKRGKTMAKDHEMEVEMLNDPKECAEHIMLVDLGRNDVGRVAKAGTVKVTELMRVERYSHVMHMVSDVVATLDENHDMFDLFAATFTAGTMTGAPKIRAMELIAQYEGIKRSFYSGSIAYFGFDGNMDSAITIRTALIKDGTVTLQAGAGIVADSVPELEYLEVHNKLGALQSSLEDLKS
ncbi:MAG: anthranilate synthase component I family protein [Thiovulaceae bacterium]|nr:anthranilate synthase component I family protein [Sulfurimonadaceae bacterium]